MNKKNLSYFFQIACFVSLLLAGCTQTNSSGGVAFGPVSWIDKPHKGTSLPFEPVEIISHSNDPGGVTQVELNVNGNVIVVLPAKDYLAISTFSWTPPEPGNYVLRVRAQNPGGVWGDYTEANITVGNPTVTIAPIELPVCGGDTPTPTLACPTLPPTPIGYVPPQPPVCGDTPTPVGGGQVKALVPSFTPTPPGIASTPTSTLAPMDEIVKFFPCISPTPTLAGYAYTPTPTLAGSTNDGPTPAPPSVCDDATPTPVCITPTPTQPPAGGQITFTHKISTSQFFYGGCTPGQVTISVEVSDPKAVRSVVLFTRMEDQGSGEQTPWDAGTSMNRAGTGRYQITLGPNSIANYNKYGHAWLVYQFVATDTKEEALARSPRIYDVALSTCGSAPPVRKKIITVTPYVLPPINNY